MIFIWYNSTIIIIIGTTYDDRRNYDATLMKYEKRGGLYILIIL